MTQLHKRFSDEQVIFLFQAYEQGLMTREEVQDTLAIGRSRFLSFGRNTRKIPKLSLYRINELLLRGFLQKRRKL